MNVLFRPVTPLVGAHFLNWSQLNRQAGLAACLSVLIPITALAQTSERDPLDMRTATPPPVYESAFTDYKPYQDPEIISWKAANDVVREFGGMASMRGMADDNRSAHDAHKPSGAEQPVQPSHDGSYTTPAVPATTPPAAPSKSKPTDMKPMPGHDMSKMPQKAPASAPKPAPAPKPAAPAMPNSIPGHGGMHH